MSDPIGGKTADNLTAKTTPAETDYILMAENKMTKRTKISDFLTFLKDKLGINTLNTKIIYRVDTYTGNDRSDLILTKTPGTDYACINAYNASYQSQPNCVIDKVNGYFDQYVAFLSNTLTSSQTMQVATVWIKK